MENLKTLGAVEVVLGLLEVSLCLILIQVNPYFKKEYFVIFIAGGWMILTGLTLICGGRKPSYSCVKSNVIFHLTTAVFSAIAFGAMVRYVPFRTNCPPSVADCESDFSKGTKILVNGILAVSMTIFLVGSLISLSVILIGGCSMLNVEPQPEEPECVTSTTSEPLCPTPK